MEVNTEKVKSKPTVNEIDRIKALLSQTVHTQLNGIILGLTQVIRKPGNLDPCIRYNLNMVVENGNLLLALFEGIMDDQI